MYKVNIAQSKLSFIYNVHELRIHVRAKLWYVPVEPFQT